MRTIEYENYWPPGGLQLKDVEKPAPKDMGFSMVGRLLRNYPGKVHPRNITSKLSVRNRVKAVVRARTLRILQTT